VAQEPAVTAPIDAAAREIIRSALDDTLVVEAAAGTGKTTALVERMVRVLATGRAQMRGLVAVTFTEKAAGELKLRLRQELEKARAAAGLPAYEHAALEAALGSLEEAQIGTIHGFCADLLKENPVEAGVDPLFVVLTEDQARRRYDEAFSAWFQATLREMPEGVRRSLRRSSRPGVSGDGDADGPVDRLRSAGWNLTEWRDFPAAWTRPDFARASEIDRLTTCVRLFAEITRKASSVRDPLYLDTAPARRAADELPRLIADDDLDGAEALLVDLCRDRDFRRARKGYGPQFAKEFTRAATYEAHQELVAQLDSFRMYADADLAALLREELWGSLELYADLKARRGELDFFDLLHRARNLVCQRDDVRAALQERCARIFVDEFQDTDPLQAELLLLLAADDPAERDWTAVRPAQGKLFVVGDPKQSIYRFRRADVQVYHQVCRQLRAHGARPLRLTTSFRSVPALQQVVNAAFSRVMEEDDDTLQAGYIPLSPSRPATATQPSVVALPVPKPYGRRNVSAMAIEASLPDAVGAFIAWLVQESGWTVTTRQAPGTRVPIQPGHICILFRRFVSFGDDVTRDYVDALEARGVRHLLVGGRAFHDREEIETLRAALAAIEWPDDELSVFATLRGALFAIGDAELLEYRHAHGRALHPFRVPANLPPHLAPIGDTLTLLAKLHTQRNRRPVAETVTRLLDATRAHVGFALRRSGEQVLANVLHVAELARQYERNDGLSFRGFVETLRDAAERGDATEAPIVEDGSDGVRLMTVHKAKGLEFPVVVLADITAKLAQLEASRSIDVAGGRCALRIGGWSPMDLIERQAIEHARDLAEGVRLAYVAATRARDLLVVPGVGDEPYDGGWVSPLNAALYPPVSQRRSPSVAPACPPFKRDSVLERPDAGVAPASSVGPGLHRVGDGEAAHEIVWWDPGVLHLDAEAPFGLRRQELIERGAPPHVIDEGTHRHEAWEAARRVALARGRAPWVAVATMTEWAAGEAAGVAEQGPLDGVPEPEVVTVAPATGRPSGPRFGTLVHAALATVPLDADRRALETLVATHGRIVGAEVEEVAAAVSVVDGVLRHPLVEAARVAERAGVCHRELPLTMLDGDLLLEGVADLAFEHDGVMMVVDFKTDRPEPDTLDRYARQVRTYAAALMRATGKAVRPVLLQV
jgi:ATP-dependent exoDNAse (exonuclease V) beta subunit